GSVPTHTPAEDRQSRPTPSVVPDEAVRATDLSMAVLNVLWGDGEFVLSRAVRGERLPPLLTMTPASSRPAANTVARLERAYALRDELDPAWATVPLAVVRWDGRPTLLLEDPGGEVLAGLIGRPWEAAALLRIGIGLAAALGRLHARGLVHKAIRPANILVNVAIG